MGAIVLCMHLDGETHRVTPEAHEAEGHGECCHHDEETDHDSVAAVHDCDACIDTEIELDELGEATPKVERLSVKAPLSALLATFDFEAFAANKVALQFRLLPVRGPPEGASAILESVKKTVLRV